MDVSLIPLWVTSGAGVIGVVYAIARNGSRGKKQDEQLKIDLRAEVSTVTAEVADVNKKLEDPNFGLTAIKHSVDEQKLHCAQVSTAIASQVETNSKEIAILRKRKK